MPITKRLTLETLDSRNPGELTAFLEQVMEEGLKNIRAETAELLQETHG